MSLPGCVNPSFCSEHASPGQSKQSKQRRRRGVGNARMQGACRAKPAQQSVQSMHSARGREARTGSTSITHLAPAPPTTAARAPRPAAAAAACRPPTWAWLGSAAPAPRGAGSPPYSGAPAAPPPGRCSQGQPAKRGYCFMHSFHALPVFAVLLHVLRHASFHAPLHAASCSGTQGPLPAPRPAPTCCLRSTLQVRATSSRHFPQLQQGCPKQPQPPAGQLRAPSHRSSSLAT